MYQYYRMGGLEKFDCPLTGNQGTAVVITTLRYLAATMLEKTS